MPVNNVVEQPGERHSLGEPGLTSPSQAVDTRTTGPSEVSRATSGEPSRAATLLYPQYLWAQVMERQMGPQQEVPPMGPGMQGAGQEMKAQTGQGEGDPALSPTSWCPALHHTGTLRG